MLIASSEGGLLDNFMGRYSAKGIPNLDLLNGSFSGDYFGGGRAGRTVRPIERPVLAMALLPQPVVLAALAGNHFLAQKGTLSRFIFWVAKELAGTRSPEARPRPEAAIAAWDILLRDLLSIPPTDDPYIIRPSREATEVLMEWRREGEARLLTESNEGMRSWLVRSSGQQQRLAALMHFFEHGASGIVEEIGPESAERAATLIRALEPHARLAFDMIDESGVVSRARRVVEWSARRGGADETRRDISRGPLKGLSGSDRDEVLKELEGRGWVRLERKETGGRPSDIVQFHPLSGSGLKGQKGQKVTKGSQEGLLSPSDSFGTRNGKTEEGGGDLAEELFREAMRERHDDRARRHQPRAAAQLDVGAGARAPRGRSRRRQAAAGDHRRRRRRDPRTRRARDPLRRDPTARRARPCTDDVDRRADAARDRQIRCRALRRLRRTRRAPDGARGTERAIAHPRAGRHGSRSSCSRARRRREGSRWSSSSTRSRRTTSRPPSSSTTPAPAMLVGRCHECNGAVHAGAATIAIGWPVRKPVWKTFTPSLARTDKHDAALTRAPAKNSKLHALLAGELQMLCSPCAMNWKYGGIAMRPPAAPIEEGTLETLVAEPTATLLHDPEPRAQVARAAVPEGGPEVVGGLIDREKTITTAIRALDVDHRRLAAVKSAVAFVNDDAELRYRILTIAWQLDRPLRIKTATEDAVRLEELVDLALRGGSVERALERT